MLWIPTQGMQYISEYTCYIYISAKGQNHQPTSWFSSCGTVEPGKTSGRKQKCWVKHVVGARIRLMRCSLGNSNYNTYTYIHSIWIHLTLLLLLCSSKPAKPKCAGFDCASQHAIDVSNSMNTKAQRMICQEPSLCDCQKSLHHSNQKYQWNAAALAAIG